MKQAPKKNQSTMVKKEKKVQIKKKVKLQNSANEHFDRKLLELFFGE